MVHSKKKEVSQPVSFCSTLKPLKRGETSSEIAISESVFPCLVCFILFGVLETLCKSEGGGDNICRPWLMHYIQAERKMAAFVSVNVNVSVNENDGGKTACMCSVV